MNSVQVDSFNEKLAQAWRQKDFVQGEKVCRSIEPSLANLKENNYLLAANLSWFSPLNYPRENCSCVGIFVCTSLFPSKVLEGSNGAGSEYAVVALAEELAALGYYVYVFCDINPDVEFKYCRAGCNPQYLPIKRIFRSQVTGAGLPNFINSWEQVISLPREQLRLQHLIIWRTIQDPNYIFSNYAEKTYLWSHDVLTSSTYLNYFPDAIYVLSNWHKKQLQETLGDQNFVVGCNGITEYDYPSLDNLTRPIELGTRCIYASNYLRGLETLLSIWPAIKEEVPLATLDIYYGRQTYIGGTEEKVAQLVETIEQLEPLGVRECGKVSHERLCSEMEDSSFLLYPYAGGSETFCITALTAAACGCLPIVSKRDALKDTLSIQEKDLIDPADFTTMAIELMKDEERANALRIKYAQHARQYTWKKAASIWQQIFEDDWNDESSNEDELSDEVRCKIIEE